MTIELSAHAPTSFIEANGVKYAYRRLGQPRGVPLVFLLHFTGTMRRRRRSRSAGQGARRVSSITR